MKLPKRVGSDTQNYLSEQVVTCGFFVPKYRHTRGAAADEVTAWAPTASRASAVRAATGHLPLAGRAAPLLPPPPCPTPTTSSPSTPSLSPPTPTPTTPTRRTVSQSSSGARASRSSSSSSLSSSSPTSANGWAGDGVTGVCPFFPYRARPPASHRSYDRVHQRMPVSFASASASPSFSATDVYDLLPPRAVSPAHPASPPRVTEDEG